MKYVLSILAVAGLLATMGAASLAAPAPRGGILIIADGIDATTLDGHLYTDSPTAERMDHLCETLFDLTADGKIVPRLAASHSFSADAPADHPAAAGCPLP